MHDDPVDLSPLDRAANTAAWEGLIARVLASAEPELARRAAALPSGALIQLARWATPALSAAAALAIVSLAGLALSRDQAPAASPRGELVESLLGEPASRWLARERPPVAADLILALEEEAP